jgi:hypothetical protein
MLYSIIIAFAALVALLAMLIGPSTAYAWGPATHLELGSEVIRNLARLPIAIRHVLAEYPYDFLYGKISADIVVGKNLVEELKHCHNWRFGFKLLKKAGSDSQRSFAWGYLAHLAADTVGHNLFIPQMMVRSFSSSIRRHIYWEMRFDTLADKRVWKIPKKIVREVHRDNDGLLRSTLEGTPLSFRTNKTIFSSLLSLQRVESWHHMTAHLSKNSKWALHRENKSRFFTLAFLSVTDVLTKGEGAACVKTDPTGKAALKAAKTERRKLKKLQRTGGDWEGAMDRALLDIRNKANLFPTEIERRERGKTGKGPSIHS